MVAATALCDYLLLTLISLSTFFLIITQWARNTVTRPLPVTSRPSMQTRSTLNSTTCKPPLYGLIGLVIWGALLLLPALLYINQREVFTANMTYAVTEHNWLYLNALFLLVQISWIIYYARSDIERTSGDALLALLVVVSCMQFYLWLTNLWVLIVLLECQGIALILLINTDASVNKNTLSRTLTSLKQDTPHGYATAMLTQFWIGFAGAALMLLAGGFYAMHIGATHWADLVLLASLVSATHSISPALACALVAMLFSMLLKAGAFPIHFWKPELYLKLKFSTVYIYAVTYSSAVLFLVIFIVAVLHWTMPQVTTYLLDALILSATYVMVPLLLMLVELKAFLAYTSGLHVIYIYAGTLVDRLFAGAALLYNLAYCLAAMTIFTAILIFKKASLKYLTDLQAYTHLPTKVFWISTAIATMAGIPPLLGFWTKFNILYNLWVNAEMVIVAHLLSISMVYMYFYVALYRFMGATNFKIHPHKLLFVSRTSIASIGICIVMLHITGTWHVGSLDVWALFNAQMMYAYA